MRLELSSVDLSLCTDVALANDILNCFKDFFLLKIIQINIKFAWREYAKNTEQNPVLKWQGWMERRETADRLLLELLPFVDKKGACEKLSLEQLQSLVRLLRIDDWGASFHPFI